jgi:hypothetical protein
MTRQYGNFWVLIILLYQESTYRILNYYDEIYNYNWFEFSTCHGRWVIFAVCCRLGMACCHSKGAGLVQWITSSFIIPIEPSYDIGWKSLFKGRFVHDWDLLQQAYYKAIRFGNQVSYGWSFLSKNSGRSLGYMGTLKWYYAQLRNTTHSPQRKCTLDNFF